MKTSFNLPVSDDYLYEEFGIEKPSDYEQIKKEQEYERTRKEAAVAQVRKQDGDGKEPGSTPAQKKSFRSWLAGFFRKAPSDGGAALDW